MSLKKPDVDAIIRNYVDTHYSGYNVASINFKVERSYDFCGEEGSSIFGGVDINLQPKPQR